MLEFISLLLLAFFMEMVDNGLGGGFGTILSPLLVIFGYDPRAIVPSILLSEMVSGLWGGGWHIKFKNVNFKAVGFTLLGSLFGMTGATYLIGSVLPNTVAKQYISIIAMMMGIFVILRSFNFISKLFKPAEKLSPAKFSVLGFAVGFNKGGTGGGYGPVSVSGYMVLGLSAASAVGTTTVAEGIACALGVVLYVQITSIVLSLAIPITIGAFIADPFSAWVNNTLKIKLNPPFHGRLVGVAMTGLGVVTLLKSFGAL